ncbi:MAG: mechanosensitive ion channel family protein [Bdellovibrionales bacterium]|nr:mechanosensitive ion channel family protein [Bdellovibrionales bacterium]
MKGIETGVEYLDRELWGNSYFEWALATLAVLLLFAALKSIHARVALLLETQKTKSKRRISVVRTLDSIVDEVSPLFLLVVSVWFVSLWLTLTPSVAAILSGMLRLACLLQAGLLASMALTYIVRQYVRSKNGDPAMRTTGEGLFILLSKITVWSTVFLLTLDNFGVDITALVAGLGVGGIAVALAVQNILGDLFASFSIVMDKPFEVDDFIIIGDYMGTIESIGMKTTRLRSLSGEQVIISNSDLLSSRIRNYKRMNERRVLFAIGVTYDTEEKRLEEIPRMIRNAIEAQDNTRFDRAHFKGFGASSLDFEVVYYVLGADYNLYMDIQQEINLSILREFREAEIDFAFPTRTITFDTASFPSEISLSRPEKRGVQVSQDYAALV